MPTIEIVSPVDLTVPTPVAIPAPYNVPAHAALKPAAGGAPVPLQKDGDTLVAVVSGLKAGQPARYELVEAAPTAGVSLKAAGTSLEVQLPEGPLGAYHFGPDVHRPYFWPLHGPGQTRVTRNYPMGSLEGEKEDHPHHKSLWTAFDEVSGCNNWHDEGDHGYTRHQEFTAQEEGPVFAGFTAQGQWQQHNGDPVLDEKRQVRVYNVGPDYRLLDYDVELTANYRDIEFGDTKEAGILSVRVATTMDGARGGLIENSEGGRGEGDCWGKRAAWVDYSGPVDGQTYGIGILSHPDNSCGTPRWHARDYGLCGTNPMSNNAFIGGDKTPYELKQGETLRFRHRVLIHRGGAQEGNVAAAYAAYTQPVTAKTA